MSEHTEDRIEPAGYEPPTLVVLGTMADLTRVDDVCDTSPCQVISDRRLKDDVTPVDPAAILSRLVELPVSAWSYRSGVGDGGRHIGPMAQDWHAAFGVGGDTAIHHVDMNGVAIAAIQALYEQLSMRERQIEQMGTRLAVLEEQLSRLEG